MDQVSPKTTGPLRVAFIKALWHADIVNQCYESCVSHMNQNTQLSPQVDVYDVPGALEIPLLAQDLSTSGQYDAIIASALVVDGGIYRHDFVASAVIDGIMRVGLDTGIPIFSAILTPHHFHDTAEHKQFFHDHFKVKGVEVAEACLSMLNVRRTLRQAA